MTDVEIGERPPQPVGRVILIIHRVGFLMATLNRRRVQFGHAGRTGSGITIGLALFA